MCGGGDQTVTQRTELDPSLQRLLYGGALGSQHGLVGSAGGMGGMGSMGDAASEGEAGEGYQFAMDQAQLNDTVGTARPGDLLSGLGGLFGGGLSTVGSYLPGGVNTANPGSFLNTAAANMTSRSQGAPTAASRPAARPFAAGGDVRSGLGSLEPQMPLMQNGSLPNLSNPEVATALAMAQMRPGMMRQRFAAGGYIEGPGTGTSDSIPATIYQDGMPVQDAALSDGEFVMTEKAVLGAGEGDRERGAARMYEMMRLFERGGRV